MHLLNLFFFLLLLTKNCIAMLTDHSSINCMPSKNMNFLIKYGTKEDIYAIACGPTITVFNVKTNKIYTKLSTKVSQKILKSHSHTITCGINSAHNNFLISSDAETIKTWDTLHNKCIKTFYSGGVTNITNLITDEMIFAATNVDNAVTLWHIQREEPLLDISIKGELCLPRSNLFSSLIMNETCIYTGLHTGTIFAIDSRTGNIIHYLTDNCCKQKISSLYIDNYDLYAGSTNNTLIIWDIRKHTCPVKSSTIKDGINPLSPDYCCSAINNIHIGKYNNEKTIFTVDQDSELHLINCIYQIIQSTKLNCRTYNNCVAIEEIEKKVYIATADGIKIVNY